MTYKQAAELNAQVRKGEHGALVVYADRFTRIEADDNGDHVEQEIPFMKGYTVFNVEQIEGCRITTPSSPNPRASRWNLLRLPSVSLPAPALPSATVGTWPITPLGPI